jgi:hypothetical protein
VGGFFMIYELIEVMVDESGNTQPFDSVMPRPPTDHPEQRVISGFWQLSTVFFKFDAFAKTHTMAKQKFRPARLGGFSGAKAYI